MKRIFILIGIIVITFSFLSAFEPRFVTDPAVSPDGNQICFVYKGDLWLVPFRGGIAKRLTSTIAKEFGPSWSPDGSKIAFSSNREGQTWVYTMPSTGGPSKPVFRDALSVCDWFYDNENLLCSRYNLKWGTSLYKVPLNGTKPILISEIGDFFSTLSPTNDKIIFNRYGDAYREAYKGSKNGDLWAYDIVSQNYQKLTHTEFTERYPRFSHISNSVYYAASDGYRFQLNKVSDNDFDNPEILTDFDIWSVRDISIARQSDRIAFELFDTIWCYDPDKPDSDKLYKLPIEIAEDNWTNLNVDESPSDSYDRFAVSSDELLLTFSHKYDLFAMPRKGGVVRQITTNQGGIENIAILSDNKTIVFTQFTDGIVNLYKTTNDTLFNLEPIDWYGQGIHSIDRFYKSTDQHWVIEYTDSLGSGRIAIADSDFSNVRPVITNLVVSSDFAISPDGTMALFVALRDDIFIRELYLYDLVNGNRHKIMNDDALIYGLVWLPNQQSALLSRSFGQKTINRLDLVSRNEFELERDHWNELLKPSSTENGMTRKSVIKENTIVNFEQIDLNHIEKRIFPILTDSDFLYAIKAIDDTSFYYFKDIRGKDAKIQLSKVNIYGKFNTDIATLPSNTHYQFSGDNVYHKDKNKLKFLNLKSKSKSEISNSFNYSYNLHKLNISVFEQVWGIFGRNFYDPKMHNTDWVELYLRFKPYLQYAEDVAVLDTIIEEMIGELNASHTGYYARPENNVTTKALAYLGIELNQRNVLSNGVQVSRIYPGSSLFHYYNIKENDVLVSIDGVKLTPYVSLDSLLIEKADKKIELEFNRMGALIKASIKGLNWNQNRELWYQDKVDRLRAKTNELSYGRIGYVNIPRMSKSEYDNFISELFTKNADKEALIIDIRGNIGGRIHDDLLSFLSRRPNAWTTSRRSGAERKETPRRTWNKPIVLLIDENSFSDAEIFPQLFKEAELGIVIGVPTSGSVIGTWEATLMDGSSMRMPGSGWYRLDGTNMEGNGAEPDILIEMSLSDLINENDTQLRKAVQVLLEQLD